ncbi:MAG: beta-ketoacyl-ACP synthase II [Candidatus Omnitrophica bacterium]|nr:beta-ketoacyl-ACP synthase II [Candidatus Omnitrophota bacterium]
MRRVVITGSGVVSPVGIGKQSFWNAVVEGKSGISRITQIDVSGFESHIGGEVKDFVPPPNLSPKEVRRLPNFVQFALKASHEAIVESGLDSYTGDPYSIGVIIGSGIGCLQAIEHDYEVFLKRGPKKISPFLIPTLITNEAAGNVAIHYNFRGPNFCTVTACASGAHAIGEAYRTIKCGSAEAIVCGGTEASITYLGVGGFCALKALSTRNDDPTKASRPFDRDRDGFIIAEGAGILVLEELEHAKKRRAKILAEVVGYAATCDAYHITAPRPSGEAAAKAMSLALKESGHSLDCNIYINAHGTSTQLNDKMETNAIKLAFGDKATDVNISSTKSVMGHTLGAAGAIEFIVCRMALENSVIPPTINYDSPDPECDLNYTPNNAREMDLDLALSNSLGFGGHNATLLLKKFV